MEVEQRLREFYDAFNERDLDLLLPAMVEHVDWPNGWEGGRERGREAVRAYWTRQWAAIDPQVTPLAFTTRPDGRVAVDVHQVIRGLDGSVLNDGNVVHVYELHDGRVARMDIEQPAG